MLLEEHLGPWSPASPETEAFRDRLEKLLEVVPPPEQIDVNEARRLRAEGQGVLPIDGPLPEAQWVDLPHAPAGGPGRCRLIETAGADGVYFHIHGGGWTFGSPDHFDGRNLRLARAANVSVVSAAYRLAPENRWPAGAEDCFAAAQFALDYAAERGLPIVFGGESAGAHLSVVTMLRLRALGRSPPVAGAVLAYGCFDLRGTPSAMNWGPRNLVLSTPILRWFIDHVLGPDGDPNDPDVSPLLADVSGMPPALFFVGDQDPLLDDTLFMAQRWRAAGASATLEVWTGAIHAFDYFVDPMFQLPIAAESQERQAQFVRARVEAARG